MGCRQITPPLVGLARRLEGEPFHLVASHTQDTSSQREVIGFLKANGLSVHTPNVTITKNGRHPDVPGNGFVPYYIVFDHTGKLVRHHMGGSYHGGDGRKMVEVVDALLKDAPAIWLGPEPFPRNRALAAKIASGKALGGSLRKLEALRAGDPEPEAQAELDRLHAVLTRHRDRTLRRAIALQGSQPSKVLKALKDLARTYKGTSLAEPIDTSLAALSASDALKQAVAMEKRFGKIVRAFEKVKEDKRTDALVEKTVAKLEALIEGQEELPFAETVLAYLANLR